MIQVVAPVSTGHQPRLGFVGVGWIGRSRMQSLAQSGAASIRAVADPSVERREAARAVVPRAEPFSSLDELLECELDGIVIATPSALHAEQCIRALELGLAVFCQKPLARTAAEARRVIDAARAADRLLAVDLSYRFTTAMRAVRGVVRSGAIGDVFAADLTFHNAYGPDQDWARDPALAGGGCVIDLGTHLVDLALWTLDFPHVRRVAGQVFHDGRPLTATRSVCEDFALATIELETGATLRLACSWAASTGRDADIEIAFRGRSGSVAMRNVDGSFFDFRADLFRGTAAQSITLPPDDWSGRALVDWSRRLGRGDGFDSSIERMVDVATVLDGVLGR
jgi:predicted dehydrogenase